MNITRTKAVRAARLRTTKRIIHIGEVLDIYEDTGILDDGILRATLQSIYTDIMEALDVFDSRKEG